MLYFLNQEARPEVLLQVSFYEDVNCASLTSTSLEEHLQVVIYNYLHAFDCACSIDIESRYAHETRILLLSNRTPINPLSTLF